MIYRVRYSSMTASYGPHYIEADSEYEAKRKFCNNGTFRQSEMALMSARAVSPDEIRKALRSANED